MKDICCRIIRGLPLPSSQTIPAAMSPGSAGRVNCVQHDEYVVWNRASRPCPAFDYMQI